MCIRDRCRAAVDSNSYALYYVPEGLKPPELCMTAVKRNGLVLEMCIRDRDTTTRAGRDTPQEQLA